MNDKNIDLNFNLEIGYKIDKKKKKIFGEQFVKNNKDKCKIIYSNKEYELKEYYEEFDNSNNELIKFQLKTKNNNDINMSQMFSYCDELISIKINEDLYEQKIESENNNNSTIELDNSIDANKEQSIISNDPNEQDDHLSMKLASISKISETNNSYFTSDMNNIFTENNHITNISRMFEGCKSLILLPDISKWNISNTTSIEYIFYECESLKSIPDISKWDTSNIKNMEHIFHGCSSLTSLPDISKWDTSNVKKMNNMFNECKSLNSLPDISKWNTSNVTSMSNMFNECKSLVFLPDISKWDISNVEDMSHIFSFCESLLSIPCMSKWKTGKVYDFMQMFHCCKLLTSLTGISSWDTSNAKTMNGIFF